MNKKIILRILLDICIAIAVLNAWWFFALPLIIIGAWFFPYFIEAIIAGIAYDSLFGLIPGMGVWALAGTITSIVALSIVGGLKRFVR